MAAPLPDDATGATAAWLVTCHPGLYDLAGLHAQGYRSLANWRVPRSPRAERMQAGDRIVLWMEAITDGPISGVWGVGTVTAPVEQVVSDRSPRFAWLDRSGHGRLDHVVDTDLRLLDQPIGAEQLLADARFARSEVATAPIGSDPRVLTAPQWAVVADLLPAGWPDPARWAELDEADLPDPGSEALDARFDAVTAAELAAATGVEADTVERVLTNQYEELVACYAAGDLIVTDLSYYCSDDDLLSGAEEIERSIDVDAGDAVDQLVERLEELAGDRLVLVPNDLPETPGFLDDTGATEEEAERVLDLYWDLVLEQPARLDPFWLETDPGPTTAA